MTKAKISIITYKILREHQCSLQETSKDTSQEPFQFMTTCRKKVVDFDAVKTEFLNQMRMSEESASSVDALVIDEYNYLIEFKNGNAREEQHKILNKAKDSLLILNDITNRQIKDSRRSDFFVLVYNKKKVELTEKEKRADRLREKGHSSFALFGFGKMRGFCFQDVMTLDQESFQEEIVAKLKW